MTFSSPTPVAVLNLSTVETDTNIARYVASYREDLAQWGREWDVGATILQVPQGDQPPTGYWQLCFVDDPTAAGALGLHDLTAEGSPIGKVFCKIIQQYGQTTSRVGSHELWEMLVDPWLNRYTGPIASDPLRRDFIVEPGDLLSLDGQGRRDASGVLLSGIALPAAYYPNYGTRYDIGGVLTSGLPDVTPRGGAYLMWRGGAGFENVAPLLRPWGREAPAGITDDEAMSLEPLVGSRRERRMRGEHAWVKSTLELRVY